MREVITTGKTVEEATEAACRELGLSRDEVSVEIIDMPAKKLFKTIPAKVRVTANTGEEENEPKIEEKPAENAAPAVKAEAPKAQAAQAANEKPAEPGKVLPQEPEEEIDLAGNPRAKMAADYLESIFSAMGLTDVNLTVVKQGDATLLRVAGDEIDKKMEVRGETIQALSYLIDRSVNSGVDKKDPEYIRIRLDIAGYRNRRESELMSLADKTGREVAKTGRSRTLAPMNPYERLIVHTAISKMDGITSESIGVDVERRVVVKSLAANATDGEDWRPPRRDNRDNRGGGRGGDRRGGRPGGNRGGGGRGGDRRGGGYGGGYQKNSSTPQREYADRKRDPNAKPIVPEQREAIRDGEDLPLYGKIEL